MASKDLQGVVSVVPAIAPQALATNMTTTGFTIDTVDYESVLFVATTGFVTDGEFTFSVEESDLADMSDATVVPQADLSSLASVTALAAAQSNIARRLAYRGSKRYVRALVTQTGATTGGILSCVCVLGHPDISPTPLI